MNSQDGTRLGDSCTHSGDNVNKQLQQSIPPSVTNIKELELFSTRRIAFLYRYGHVAQQRNQWNCIQNAGMC